MEQKTDQKPDENQIYVQTIKALGKRRTNMASAPRGGTGNEGAPQPSKALASRV
jgi:hypothetical protein